VSSVAWAIAINSVGQARGTSISSMLTVALIETIAANRLTRPRDNPRSISWTSSNAWMVKSASLIQTFF